MCVCVCVCVKSHILGNGQITEERCVTFPQKTALIYSINQTCVSKKFDTSSYNSLADNSNIRLSLQ